MSQISEKYLDNVINTIALHHNLEECRHSQIKFETTAQNYFGVLIPVILTGRKRNTEVSIDMVLKLAPTDERFRVSGAITQFFAREIYVYSTILEKYQDLQRDMPISSQCIIPKCYYTSKDYCNEVIAMKNMCTDGYQPYTCNVFLDLDHIKVSLISLAKFHALSFIMRERDAKLYEEAENICTPLTQQSNKRFIDILLDRLEKAISVFENSQYEPLLKNLKENCVPLVESVALIVHQTCICHGDIWKENILFKYEDNKPISACLIDYQTARKTSPAFDILFLITTSTNSELRHKYYNELLDIYYKRFDETLREVGLESHSLYSRQMFDEDLKSVGPGCFIVANTALWLSSGLQQEGHVRSKNVLITIEEKETARNKYKTVINNILDDYINYGYLSL